MLRVTTIHASSAANTAAYYTQYLTAAPGEVPGVWSGGRRPVSACRAPSRRSRWSCCCRAVTPYRGHRSAASLSIVSPVMVGWCKAVSGFDATFSAPKSLSVWWGLTGDRRLLEAHDVAVDGSARASGAVRVDDADPPRWWPVASGHGRVDDGDVPPDDVAGR